MPVPFAVSRPLTKVAAAAKRWGRALGLEVRRRSARSAPDLRLAAFLAERDIDLVLDVGANRGQFALELFAAGYRNDIFSFEPMPWAHVELARKAAAFGGRWLVAPPLAISAVAGETNFHVNSADATSSLLPHEGSTAIAAQQLHTERVIRVKTETLDAIFAARDLGRRRVFLKVDVQGGEGLVLEGADAALNHLEGMQIEMSLLPLYQGQPLAFELIDALRARGFELHDITTAFRDPVSNRLCQIDAILFRSAD